MHSVTIRTTAIAILAIISWGASMALADDAEPEHTRSSQEVPELKLGTQDNQFAVNHTDFKLISGQGYKWKLSSAGGLEYKFKTDLWRNVWVNQIVISDLEVHMAGAPAWLEFDDEGTIQVQFNTVRPGRYKWWVDGLEDKGMSGTIVIE